jgi:hypothetical protein
VAEVEAAQCAADGEALADEADSEEASAAMHPEAGHEAGLEDAVVATRHTEGFYGLTRRRCRYSWRSTRQYQLTARLILIWKPQHGSMALGLGHIGGDNKRCFMHQLLRTGAGAIAHARTHLGKGEGLETRAGSQKRRKLPLQRVRIMESKISWALHEELEQDSKAVLPNQTGPGPKLEGGEGHV